MAQRLMRILFVGDVVGRPGREAIAGLIPQLRREWKLDAVIVNCENAAHGRGITPRLADEMFSAGVDVLTGGNHIFHFKEIATYMEREPRLIRPANYREAAGRGAYRLRLKSGVSLGVVQVEGRVFMRPGSDCPFAAARREVDLLADAQAIIVDVHAEATSEKQALAYYLDGRVSAVIGTHTHVQTADERILPQGCALLTDAGMTGPQDSVIGMVPEAAVSRFLGERGSHDVATDDVYLCGALIEVDPATRRATAVRRVREAWPRGPGQPS